MLGTYVEISVEDHSNELRILQAIEHAFETIQKVDNLMSFHRLGSELGKINRKAATQPVRVHAWTYEVLSKALEIFKLTKGSFDCAIANDLLAQGLLPGRTSSPLNTNPITSRAKRPSSASIILNDGCDVRFTEPLAIDLGGIAKGFAVDRACESLIESGLQAGCVNAGGDLRVFGEFEKAIHIRNPKQTAQLIYAGQLSHGAIATSGIYFTEPDCMRAPRSALISPRTGDPIFEKKSFTVIAKTCMVADGLTKALAVEQNPAAEYFQYFEATPLIL